jgi:hypothetical protein
MSRRDFIKHVEVRHDGDSSTIMSSEASYQLSLTPKSVSPPRSPSLSSLPHQDQQIPEWRPLATAVHPCLLHDDVGRKVVIVRGNRRATAFQIPLEDDDEDDEDWF